MRPYGPKFWFLNIKLQYNNILHKSPVLSDSYSQLCRFIGLGFPDSRKRQVILTVLLVATNQPRTICLRFWVEMRSNFLQKINSGILFQQVFYKQKAICFFFFMDE